MTLLLLLLLVGSSLYFLRMEKAVRPSIIDYIDHELDEIDFIQFRKDENPISER